MSDEIKERIVVLTTEQIGSLKVLLGAEQNRLMLQKPRNDTMIDQFSDILARLRQARKTD